MTKNFKLYIVAWAVLLIVFNVVTALIPGWDTIIKLSPSFWIGYAFVIVAFVGQLICTKFSFRDGNIKKQFYNISMIITSYMGLILTFIMGAICMIVPVLPYWMAAIDCSVVFALNVVAVMKAKMAIEIVNDVDDKIEQGTAFIYSMRSESEGLVSRASTEEIKASLRQVRDAFKYSDPMSNNDLSEVETDIRTHFILLSQAVRSGDAAGAEKEKKTVLDLIAERNAKCKILKQ